MTEQNKKKAATIGELNELHSLVTKVMKGQLEKPASLTAADLSNILKFLKDNGIEAFEDEELKSLVSGLKANLPSATEDTPFH